MPLWSRPPDARFQTLPFRLPPPHHSRHSRVLDVSTEGALPASNYCRRNSQTCSLPSRLGSARCGSAFKNSSPQSGPSFVSEAGSVRVQCPTWFLRRLCVQQDCRACWVAWCNAFSKVRLILSPWHFWANSLININVLILNGTYQTRLLSYRHVQNVSIITNGRWNGIHFLMLTRCYLKLLSENHNLMQNYMFLLELIDILLMWLIL